MASLLPDKAGIRPAEEIASQASGVGVVLVHGLNGSRFDMLELETYLSARGLRVVNLLLPGHGAVDATQALAAVTWQDWVRAVRDALYALKRECACVFLVGHSLGGGLVLYVAAHEPVDAVVAMCTPLRLYSWALPFIRLARRLVPHIRWAWEDIRDPAARRAYSRQRIKQSYQWRALAAIENLFFFLPQLRAALPAVTAPVLLMVALHDHVVPVRDGHEIYRRIRSQEKYLLTLRHSYHLITKDYDREEVFAKTADFLIAQARKRGVAVSGESHEAAWALASAPLQEPPHPDLPARSREWWQRQWQATTMRTMQITQNFTSWATLVYTQTAKKWKLNTHRSR
jgi:carboxylesterase